MDVENIITVQISWLTTVFRLLIPGIIDAKFWCSSSEWSTIESYEKRKERGSFLPHLDCICSGQKLGKECETWVPEAAE